VLVDAAVAAQLLSVPKTWLLAEARAGRVPHRRLGKYVRFCRAELTAWATGEGETGSGPVPATPDRRVPTGIRDASKASDTNGTTNSGAQRAA
jgi:excisionase family DNA binding protein